MGSVFGGNSVVLTAGSPNEQKKMCCCSPRAGTITVACVYLVISLAIGGYFTYLTATTYDPWAFGFFCATAVLEFLSSVFQAVLLYGAVKRKHKAIFAWIIVEGITIGLALGTLIRNIFSGNINALLALPVIVVRFVFLRAISFYYKELKQQTQSPPPYVQENL